MDRGTRRSEMVGGIDLSTKSGDRQRAVSPTHLTPQKTKEKKTIIPLPFDYSPYLERLNHVSESSVRCDRLLPARDHLPPSASRPVRVSLVWREGR